MNHQMVTADGEETLLRSSALQIAQAVLAARREAETALERARDALKSSQDRLHLALAAGQMGDWTWDARTDRVQLGPHAAKLFELPSDPFPWSVLEARIHDEDRQRFQVALAEAVTGCSPLRIELRVRGAEGVERWLAVRGAVECDEDGPLNGFTAVVQDITPQTVIARENARLYEEARSSAEERRTLLESERAARTEAERLSAVKDEFLATLSHELRTPLNAIVGWLAVLRRADSTAADLAQGLATIERNARMQAQLIDDLLDMNRITTGKMRLDVQTIDPHVFIEAAIESVRPAAEAKGVRLEALLDPSAGPISGDAGRLQQVAWNLLSNAVKFTPRGGKVQVVLQRVSSHIELSVADTGMGIKPEFLGLLFERFRQADASTTRKYGGLGLGLSIAKQLVELHGGTVQVMSDGEGAGTTVRVRLPALVTRGSVATGPHPTAARKNGGSFDVADLGGLRVLVVDDQADTCVLLRRLLEACHAEVVTTSDPSAVTRLVEELRPDVLVSDIGMPEVDGYELLGRVRALGEGRGGSVPAIALTAFARTEDRVRALRAGFRVHLAKPVEPSEFIAAVASVSGRSDSPA